MTDIRPSNPVETPVTQVSLQNLVLGVALALMVGWFLHVAAEVLVPMVLALMIAYVVSAIAALTGAIPLVGARLPTGLRYTLAALLIGYGLIQLVTILAANLVVFAAKAPEYQVKFLEMAQALASSVGFQGDLTWETLRNDLFGKINLQATLRTGVISSAALLGGLVFVLLNVVFMLLEQGSFDAKLDRLSADPVRTARLRAVVGDINYRVGRYLAVKSLINVVLGLACYAVMVLFGLEFAVLWAIIIALVNYIPYLGSAIGVVVPTMIAVGQFGQLDQVLLIAVALSVVQFMIGNVLEPQIMGNSLDLSPYAILISLTVWTSLWGIAGAIVAIPITAVLVIVLSEFSGTRPIAILLSRSGVVGESRLT
jgi:predicted PurR-regulated permease PerM